MSLNRLSVNMKTFFMIFLITFSIFVFTNDGHRYTFDEALAQDQSIRIATLQPHPDYVQGESRPFFEYPWLYPPTSNARPICQNAIICSHASVLHSFTQAPFLIINENLNIITHNTKELEYSTFNDQSYVLWRNSLDPNFTFMELFYGPFFSALSASVLFLVSRTFFSVRTSIILSFLFGFSTILWAYSQTSLNSIPATLFILLGFLFFRYFQKQFSYKPILLSAIFLGVAYLTRQDAILVIIPLFFYFLYEMIRHDRKIINSICFIVPLFAFYGISQLIQILQQGFGGGTTEIVNMLGPRTNLLADMVINTHESAFGLLFSPGVGLLIFAPIIIAGFLSFPDFFRRYKLQCILFSAIIGLFLLFYGSNGFWHGLNAWGPRYMLVIVAFFILPLGAIIEKRTNISYKIGIAILGVLGVFFNLVYLVQDVSWFVWGVMATRTGGLYDVGGAHNLWISPLVLWTFEFSQLTHSIIRVLTNLQHDIFLLHIFGAGIYSVIVCIVLVPLIFLFFQRTLRYTE